MSAVDARHQLELVIAERHVALAAGLGGNATYMAHLETDLEACRTAYVALAVTEIAVLRADLGGRLAG